MRYGTLLLLYARHQLLTTATPPKHCHSPTRPCIKRACTSQNEMSTDLVSPGMLDPPMCHSVQVAQSITKALGWSCIGLPVRIRTVFHLCGGDSFVW